MPSDALGGFPVFLCGVTRWQILRSERVGLLKTGVSPLPVAVLKRCMWKGYYTLSLFTGDVLYLCSFSRVPQGRISRGWQSCCLEELVL